MKRPKPTRSVNTSPKPLTAEKLDAINGGKRKTATISNGLISNGFLTNRKH